MSRLSALFLCAVVTVVAASFISTPILGAVLLAVAVCITFNVGAHYGVKELEDRWRDEARQ